MWEVLTSGWRRKDVEWRLRSAERRISVLKFYDDDKAFYYLQDEDGLRSDLTREEADYYLNNPEALLMESLL